MKTKTADSSIIRGINRASVLDIIRSEETISRLRIASRLGLSLSTVQRIVENLISEDLVILRGDEKMGVGRPSELISLNGEAYNLLGIDLGYPTMVGLLSSLGGKINHEYSLPSILGDGSENYSRVCQIIENVLNEASKNGKPVKGIGLGIPGVIRDREGIVESSTVLGWKEEPLVDKLAERFHIPIMIDRGINLITLGEYKFGLGRGCQNMACITLGTNIQAGLIIGGELYRGSHYQAGRLGYSLPGVEWLGKQYQGPQGALDEVASGYSIVRKARQVLKEPHTPHLDELSSTNVYEAAQKGELWAVPIIAETIRHLSVAVANLTTLIDPEIIVISGKVSPVAGFIVEPLLNNIQGVVPKLPRIEVSTLGTHSTVLGAVMMLYEGIFRASES